MRTASGKRNYYKHMHWDLKSSSSIFNIETADEKAVPSQARFDSYFRLTVNCLIGSKSVQIIVSILHMRLFTKSFNLFNKTVTSLTSGEINKTSSIFRGLRIMTVACRIRPQSSGLPNNLSTTCFCIFSTVFRLSVNFPERTKV